MDVFGSGARKGGGEAHADRAGRAGTGRLRRLLRRVSARGMDRLAGPDSTSGSALLPLRRAALLAKEGAVLGVRARMVTALHGRGIVALLRALASGSQNPSLIYRIHARNAPDRVALIEGARVLTWGALDARIDRLARALRALGVTPGASVILMMHNRIEFVEASAAVARLGGSAVSVSWRSTPDELAYLANDSGAVAIVTETHFVPTLERAAPELAPALRARVIAVSPEGEAAVANGASLQVHPYEAMLDEAGEGAVTPPPDDETAVVIYTSGTTGKPKGAVRKFPKDTLLAAFRFINHTPLRADDVHLVASPLYHATAFGFLAFSLLLGNTAVILPEFKPELFVRAASAHRVTTTAVVPTMLQRILDLPDEAGVDRALASLRVVFTGGAPLPGPLGTTFMDRFGDVLFNFYGATETGLVTLASPDDLRAAPSTIGPALPGNAIRLVDERGVDVAAGEVGELYARNAFLIAGYQGNEDATRASTLDGYFSVGDLARCDAEGRYFIEGRKRDMIISGGTNVYPAEIEAVLERHPDVQEVAVVGLPDREWGEKVTAFVVARPGRNLEGRALADFARASLSGPKIPRGFVFLDELPRNATGKVLKRDLRERGAGA